MANTQNPRQGRVGLSSLLTKKSVTRYMKKKIINALYLACIAAIFAACVITNEAGDPCMWNYALLAIAVLTGGAAKKMEGAK